MAALHLQLKHVGADPQVPCQVEDHPLPRPEQHASCESARWWELSKEATAGLLLTACGSRTCPLYNTSAQ